MEQLKASSKTDPAKLAGAITGIANEGDDDIICIDVVGAAAVNQAVKAIAIANDFLEPDRLTLWCQPRFDNVVIGEKELTSISIIVEVDEI